MLKRAFWNVVLLAAAGVAAQENYSNWGFFKNIVVNTKASGANITNDVTKYPLLVRFGAADSAIFNQAGPGGASLRFTKPNGTTRLKHEIDTWNPITRTGAVWVLMDTVKGNDSSNALRLYWGNGAAADSSNGAAVFDTANGFEAVFHLSEATGDTIRDVTANRYMGIPTIGATAGSTVPKDTLGAIGSGKAFGGTNENTSASAQTGGAYRLETATGGRTNNSFDYVGNNAEFSLSAWMNIDALRPSGNFERRRGLISKANHTAATNDPTTQWYLRPNNVDRVLHAQRVTVPEGGTGPYSVVASGGLAGSVNAWNFASYVATGTMNGNNRITLSNASGSTTRLIGDENGIHQDIDVFIGGFASTTGSKDNGMLFLNGRADEVRISKVARSAEWVTLDFQTQKAASNVVTLGATQVGAPATAPTNLRYVPGNTATNDTLALIQGTAVNITPTFGGGPLDSVKVVSGGGLPAGLTVTKATGLLSGTPTATSGNASYTFRAWAAGDSTSRVVVISVAAGLSNLRYVPGNTANTDTLVLTPGVAFSRTPTVTGNSAAIDSFAITSGTTTLPAGITLNKTTGTLSGTPTALFAAANRTITAYSATLGNITRQVRISVVQGPITGFDYSEDTLSVTTGTPITTLLPSWSALGRAPTAFAAVTALPAGLSLNPLNGNITGAPTAAAADGAYATAWSRHRKILVNTTAAGANITANVTKFPLLVRFGPSDTVFNNAHATGRDIRFTKLDNTTRLPHEIDHWDNVNKTAAVWVLLDTVYGNNATQAIRMHWGNANAANLSNGHAVFDTANGFVAVWHMGSAIPAAPRENSVMGGNPALPKGPANLSSQFPRVVGVIGLADTLRYGTGTNTAAKDTSDHFNLGIGYNNFGTQMEMSGWFYSVVPAASEWQQYVSLGNNITDANGNNIWMGREGTSANNFATEVYNGAAAHRRGEGAITPGSWQYLTWTMNGTTTALYKDGVALTPTSSTAAQAINDIVRTHNFIGRSNWGDKNVAGKFDEIRLSKVARPADWVKLSYENQKTGSTMVTFANDTVVVGLQAEIAGMARISVKPVAEGLLFSIHAGDAAPARVSVIDMHGRTLWDKDASLNPGTNTLLWEGAQGKTAASGVYFVRVSILDAQGNPVATLRKKIPLTR